MSWRFSIFVYLSWQNHVFALEIDVLKYYSKVYLSSVVGTLTNQSI